MHVRVEEMPYRIIKKNRIIIQYIVLDFFTESIWETIDCQTKEGSYRYKELFLHYKAKKTKRQNIQEIKCCHIPLYVFFHKTRKSAVFGRIKTISHRYKKLFKRIPIKKNNRPVSRNINRYQISLYHFFQFLSSSKRQGIQRQFSIHAINKIITNTPLDDFRGENDTTERISNRSRQDSKCAKKRGRPLMSQRLELENAIKEIKEDQPMLGRTRTRRLLPEHLITSESTISRIFKENQLQNPAKRLASEVRIDWWLPELNIFQENTTWECAPKNGLILIIVLFQQLLEQLISPFLKKEEITVILAYSIGLLFNLPIYQSMELIPPQIAELIGIDKKLSPTRISEVLKTLGYYKEFIFLEKMNNMEAKKLVIDEKIIEKYSKRKHYDIHTMDCKIGYYYCSRRNKSVLAESIEVIADNSQQGCALPLYFAFTPHGLTKGEKRAKEKQDNQQKGQYSQSSTQSESDMQNTRITEITADSELTPAYLTTTQEKKMKKKAKQPQGKRASAIRPLIDTISTFIGNIPLSFDNNYAQKELIRYYQENNMLFIGHGKSNLSIGKNLKERMKKDDLRYDREIINDKSYGGALNVVGYQKNNQIHIYLTNELNYESAEETIKEYRKRWRLENTFKWNPQLHLMSGSDTAIHIGQLIVMFYFLTNLVYSFHATTYTIKMLIERPASIQYSNNILTIRFPDIPKRYWVKLENLVQSLQHSELISSKVCYDKYER